MSAAASASAARSTRRTCSSRSRRSDLERPVKWIEDRREHLIAANHSRDQFHKIRAAVDANGFILAIDDEFWADQGAYVRTHAATVADLTCAMLPGPYLVPAYRVAGHIRLTNKTPCGTYRAPGRYEATFVRERLIEEIASTLGKDSVEIRRHQPHPARADALPARPRRARHGGRPTTSADYDGLLDKLLALVRYDALRTRLPRGDRRASWSASASATSSRRAALAPSTASASRSKRPAASRW